MNIFGINSSSFRNNKCDNPCNSRNCYDTDNKDGEGGSPLIVKGDIFSFSTTNTRLPIGPTGSLLRANPNTTNPASDGTGLDYTGDIDPITGNTFLGEGSGIATTGISNTGYGASTLNKNTTGNNNTALGFFALTDNTSGSLNTAVGWNAMSGNMIGSSNIGIGTSALSHLGQSGNDNIAIGTDSLFGNTSGTGNTAIGLAALAANTDGSFNIGIGAGALSATVNGMNNIGIGNSAGAGLGVSDDNNIVIGSIPGATTIPSAARTFINNIFGVTPINAPGTTVVCDSNGQLGTLSSSKIFKENIEPIGDDAELSSKLLSLNPVSFTYKTDSMHTLQYGLIAEEVYEIFPNIVVMKRDENAGGETNPYTVRYDALIPLLLNEIIRLNKNVIDLSDRIAKIE